MMRKAVVLVTVIIITLLIAIMAAIVIYVMTQQAYVAENKIKRGRAEYAAMAALTELHARMRNNPANAVSNFEIGSAADGAPYPLKVTVTVTNAAAEFSGTNIQKIKLNVTY